MASELSKNEGRVTKGGEARSTQALGALKLLHWAVAGSLQAQR